MIESIKKRPVRTCTICGAKGEKSSFMRFVRMPDGMVKLDPKGREAGRGAYICTKKECFEKARKSHRLDRALRISLNEDDYNRLEHDFVLAIDDLARRKGMVD